MARTHRTTTTWAAITLAALVLTGCTGQTPPATKKTSPTPSTPTATPTPTASSVAIAPPRPAAMDDDGPRGAEAAAVYFLELEPYMQMTGETETWERMSHKSCSFCAARLKQARQVSANGDRFDGGIASATVAHAYAQDVATGVWPLNIDIIRDETRITSSDGIVVFEEQAGTDHLRVEVLHSDGQWVIQNIALLQAP